MFLDTGLERAGRKADDAQKRVVYVRSPGFLIDSLAALVPKPRVNLTRFHGVFAPNSSLRRSLGNAVKTASERHAAMSLKPSV